MLQIYLGASELLQAAALWLASDGKILGANQIFARELGYQQDDLSTMTIFQINPHLNLMEWKKVWKELESNGSAEMESEHITADGRLYPVKMQTLMVDVGAQEKVCIGIVKNLMGLTRYKDMLELVSHMARIGAYEWDMINSELIVTDTIYEILGVDQSTDLITHDNFRAFIDKFLCGDDRQRLREKVSESMEIGQPVQLPLSIRTLEGSQKDILLYIHPISKEGSTSKIYGAVHDITLQKQAIHPLEMTQFAIDNATEMIYWVDSDGKIRYSNHAFARLMGYSHQEILNCTIMDLIPGLETEQWNGLLGALIKDKYLKVELSKIRKDGTLIPVEVVANYMEYKGEPFMCKYVRDLTEQKKKEEEEAQHAADMKKALEEISLLKQQLELENSYLQEEIDLRFNFNNIITCSEQYKKVLQKIEQVANTNATVLITGETGTGKELLARAIHSNSNRSKKQMIRVNCAALPEHLIESELFGHERGAFTGAVQRKPGRFELAHLSTIFLDEIGDMPADLQAKLLRVLQEGEFERVGGTETLKCDVRVIAATNCDLKQKMEKGQFREDLYYRLNVFPIENMPLRDRPEDIPLLIRHFVKKYADKNGREAPKIPKKVFDTLEKYPFPGNIRELENIMERSVILSSGNVLYFDETLFITKGAEKHLNGESFKSWEEMQREYIQMALEKTKGRVSGPDGAARLLGMNDKTLFSKMAKLGID